METAVIQIIEGLIQKTKEKKAVWKESSTKGEYKILFNGATLTIGGFRDSYGKAYYILSIFNNEGRTIVRESVWAGSSSSQLIENLFLAAQESTLKKNDTLNSIIEQLSQDTVGEDDDSELPF